MQSEIKALFGTTDQAELERHPELAFSGDRARGEGVSVYSYRTPRKFINLHEDGLCEKHRLELEVFRASPEAPTTNVMFRS